MARPSERDNQVFCEGKDFNCDEAGSVWLKERMAYIKSLKKKVLGAEEIRLLDFMSEESSNVYLSFSNIAEEVDEVIAQVCVADIAGHQKSRIMVSLCKIMMDAKEGKEMIELLDDGFDSVLYRPEKGEQPKLRLI